MIKILRYKRKINNINKVIQEEKQEYEKLMESSQREDQLYSKNGDKDLTEEQKREILEFWKKYEFAITPPFEGFKAYYNRNGIFDPRHITYRLRKMMDEKLSPMNYRTAWQNKAFCLKHILRLDSLRQ